MRKRKCTACLKTFSGPNKGKKMWCLRCKKFLQPLMHGGRDMNREKIRIRRGHTCKKCKRKWSLGQRRFDIHHTGGLCGKRSRSYDSLNAYRRLIVLCHQCHLGLHATKKKIGAGVRARPLVGKTKQILTLRRKGATYDEIARQFNVKSATIFGHLKRNKKHAHN